MTDRFDKIHPFAIQYLRFNHTNSNADIFRNFIDVTVAVEYRCHIKE